MRIRYWLCKLALKLTECMENQLRKFSFYCFCILIIPVQPTCKVIKWSLLFWFVQTVAE